MEVTHDIQGAQWTKLLINHVNALPAITGLSVQEVVADDGLRRVMTASMRESVRVARATGVRFGSMQGVPGRVLELIGVVPLAVGRRVPPAAGPADGGGAESRIDAAEHPARAGDRDRLPQRRGRRRPPEPPGLPSPVNSAIVEMVHEVERTGAFLTPAQVVAVSDVVIRMAA